MLRGSTLEFDISIINSHFPVVPGLGSLTAGSPSATDSQVLVGHPHGAADLDLGTLGVANELVSH